MRSTFGTLPNGDRVEVFTLRANGVEARILTLGATLQSLLVPDRDGRAGDIVLGHNTLPPYLRHRGFLGAMIGRYANRIASGRFTLDGEDFTIPANDGPNALHGGPEGFDQRNWQVTGATDMSVSLMLVSPDGDQGFPGELTTQATWSVAEGLLSLELTATTTRATPVSLTNHAFFNLSGAVGDAAGMRDVLDHRLTISASRMLAVDGWGIPEGAPVDVAGTAFDFRDPRRIGEAIRAGDPQLLSRKGYDHCYCLDGADLRPVARVEDPGSGRVMEMLSDQPGLQFYSGNFLDGTVAGKNGVAPRMGDALCLEPCGWPDAPNRPDFPNSILRPGESYRNRMELRFSLA